MDSVSLMNVESWYSDGRFAFSSDTDNSRNSPSSRSPHNSPLIMLPLVSGPLDIQQWSSRATSLKDRFRYENPHGCVRAIMKKVFQTLLNLCINNKAIKSFRAFENEYYARGGSRVMCRRKSNCATCLRLQSGDSPAAVVTQHADSEPTTPPPAISPTITNETGAVEKSASPRFEPRNITRELAAIRAISTTTVTNSAPSVSGYSSSSRRSSFADSTISGLPRYMSPTIASASQACSSPIRSRDTTPNEGSSHNATKNRKWFTTGMSLVSTGRSNDGAPRSKKEGAVGYSSDKIKDDQLLGELQPERTNKIPESGVDYPGLSENLPTENPWATPTADSIQQSARGESSTPESPFAGVRLIETRESESVPNSIDCFPPRVAAAIGTSSDETTNRQPVATTQAQRKSIPRPVQQTLNGANPLTGVSGNAGSRLPRIRATGKPSKLPTKSATGTENQTTKPVEKKELRTVRTPEPPAHRPSSIPVSRKANSPPCSSRGSSAGSTLSNNKLNGSRVPQRSQFTTPQRSPSSTNSFTSNRPPRSSSQVTVPDYTIASSSEASSASRGNQSRPAHTDAAKRQARKDSITAQNLLGPSSGTESTPPKISSVAGEKEESNASGGSPTPSTKMLSMSKIRGLFRKNTSPTSKRSAPKKAKKIVVNNNGSPLASPVGGGTSAANRWSRVGRVPKPAVTSPVKSASPTICSFLTPGPTPSRPSESAETNALAMSLLNSARDEPHSPRKEHLLALGTAMVESITNARDAEKAMEEAKMAARNAELSYMKAKKSVLDVMNVVRQWQKSEGGASLA